MKKNFSQQGKKEKRDKILILLIVSHIDFIVQTLSIDKVDKSTW